MYTVGTHARRLLGLAIGATIMLVLCVLPFRSDVAHGDRIEQDPEIYLPLVMKRYCSDWWRDDFTDPTSGWPVVDSERVKLEYLAGEYHILIKQANSGASCVTSPPVYATNFTLEVDGRSDFGIYGLLFGRGIDLVTDILEWYSFELGPGTDWALCKYKSGEYWHLVLDSGYSSHITSGMNHLKVVREGSQIEAYVNGQLLSTVTDGSFLGSRMVGLTAGSADAAPVDFYFDNFAVCPVDSAPGVGAVGAPGIGKGIILRKGAPPAIDFWPR